MGPLISWNHFPPVGGYIWGLTVCVVLLVMLKATAAESQSLKNTSKI